MRAEAARRETRATVKRCFGRGLLLALVLTAFTPTVQAENNARRGRLYITELAIILESARRALLWVETYAGDAELAGFAYPLTEQYVVVASRMTPPARLTAVHPHLVIIVENVERALDAAAEGDMVAFRQRARIVREELVTLDAVLKHLKVRLPELAR
jgi:hypothetical protein